MEKVQAYVLMEVEPRRVADVVESARQVRGIEGAFAVTGRYDVVVEAVGADFADLANDILPRLREIGGVSSTETAIVIDKPREEL
jgi:DNA-binding Lrp family transcriptional regulator